MGRIRVGFLLLAVVLLAPLGLLLARTLEGLGEERERRHDAVAGRVFDEAERQLTAFLEDEEARPAGDYRPGAASPLAGPPARGFVVGYFQLSQSGALQAPRAEGAAGFLAELRPLLPEPAPAGSELAEAERPAKRKSDAKALQRPGTTRAVQKIGIVGRVEVEDQELRPAAEADARAESLSSYGVIDRLNQAARSRRDARKEVAAAERAPTAGARISSDADAAAESAADTASHLRLARQRPADAGAEPAPAEERPAFDDVQGFAARMPPALAPRAAEAVPPAPAREAREKGEALAEANVAPAAPPASPPPRLELGPSPLAGAPAGPGRLLLYRTAVVAGENGPVRQGLLVDTARLAEWLRAEVLGKGGLLDSLVLEFRAEGEPWPGLADPAGRFVYEHRFGEPFETVSARLLLAPLPDVGGTQYVYWMALLLVLASTAGVYAVYRRVAVAVHFAERRSNFAAAVSHELKTPLTAIRMYAEMLRDGMVDDDAKRHEYYATITSESERLTRLINNVLEFSKLEGQRRELASVTASIEQPLRDVVRVVEPHAAALGFTVAVDVAPGLPDVPHDPDALQQILFNAVDNALKYSRDAERREVGVSARAEEGGVVLRVRDHGPGVAAAHLPHVFDAFYRGESEWTRRAQGTGIGLALVRGLAEQMGGSVAVRNHPEGGLELTLRLPR